MSEAKVTTELIWHGDEIVKQLIEAERHTISQGVNLMRDAAIRRCPVRRGDLRDSIKARMKKGFPEGYVSCGGREAPHAHLVEDGTVKMRARPFMRPAFDENVSTVKALHLQEMRKVVK